MLRRTCLPVLLAALLGHGCGDEAVSCDLDRPCQRGSYCFAGECRTDCDAQHRCPVGVCTSDGRCARDQPDPTAGVCAAMVLDAQFGIPTVVLLVDQSGSMTAVYSAGTRWTVLRDALIDPTTGIVTALQASIRFGLTLYTNTGGPPCPDLTVVEPALNNRDAMATVYEAAQPEAETPTGESIDEVVNALLAYREVGPKYIIVASDGEPDTCAVPNPQNGQPEAVAAAQRAFASGIKLYFISVGSGTVSQQHMQDMANAGVGYPIGGTLNAPYYEAADADQLGAAFATITGSLLTCELTVNGTIDPAAADTGVIYLDGHQLLLDDPNGWQVIDETSFRLLGTACSRAQRAGGHVVTAEFGCEAGQQPGLTVAGGGMIEPGCNAAAGVAMTAFLPVAVVALAAARRRRTHPRRAE